MQRLTQNVCAVESVSLQHLLERANITDKAEADESQLASTAEIWRREVYLNATIESRQQLAQRQSVADAER